MSGWSTKRVYLLYGLSGLASLGYQVVWFRFFVDKFGSTNLTFVLVLCNFIGGLAAGALCSEWVTDRLARHLRVGQPLRLYGLIEIVISATMVLTLVCRALPADLWGHFPYSLGAHNIYGQTLFYQFSKVVIASCCVFVPCFFMGTTFPLLCHTFEADKRFPAALYAWNTLGACSGVLACEFIFLPRVGYVWTLLVMMGLNLLLGLFFVVRGGGVQVGRTRRATSSSLAAPAASVSNQPSVLLACAVLSGVLCGALEGDMFKRLWFVNCNSQAAMSFISFWAILGIFLASTTVRLLPRLKLIHIKFAFVAALVAYATVWYCVQPYREWSLESQSAALQASLSDEQWNVIGQLKITAFGRGHGFLLLVVGVFVFPAYYLSSLLLPYVCNRIQADRRHLGLAYGLNTVAFCVGMVGFSWVAPRVNIFYSLKLFMVFFATVVVFFFLLREGRRVAVWKPALGVLVFAGTCLLVPRTFDPSYVDAALSAAYYPVRAMKSNGAHTTYVVDKPGAKALYFDGHSMSGCDPVSHKYMRLMAHFPLLLHPQPRRALLICFGVGNTASAIAAHEGIERIDVVDLNDKVFETAPEFADENRRVYLDPRLYMIHDDGRNFLNLTDRMYDLVTSEPPPPMQEGVYRLYSKEYYESVLDHLTPRGMMTQWLPVWEMPRKAVELAAHTFIEVFPHTLMFVGGGRNFILVGSGSPLDVTNIERRFAGSGAVVEDLRRIGLEQPLDMLVTVVQGDRMLHEEYDRFGLISDARNDWAHFARNPLDPAIVRYNPPAMLEDIRADRLSVARELRETVMNLARLVEVVEDFPLASLLSVRRTDAEGVAYSEANWGRVRVLNRKAKRAQDEQRFADSIGLYRRSLKLVDGQREVLAALAQLETRVGDYEQAIATWQRYLTLGAKDIRGDFGIGLALCRLDRYGEALPYLQAAIERDSGKPRPHKVLGDALLHLGQYAEAVESYDAALAIEPGYTGAKRNRSVAELKLERRQ